MDEQDRAHPLPVERWASTDEADRCLLSACVGATLDVGCGPGRMSHALTAAGTRAVGIDISCEAVRQTRARGATAMLRDVFGAVPLPGRWDTVLLADGNIGIGGDPARLLRRAHDLLAVGGRVVVDLAPPGSQSGVAHYRLAGAGLVSRSFPWAHVPVDAIAALAAVAGFSPVPHRSSAARWSALLVKDISAAA